jgi:hypothetical protein
MSLKVLGDLVISKDLEINGQLFDSLDNVLTYFSKNYIDLTDKPDLTKIYFKEPVENKTELNNISSPTDGECRVVMSEDLIYQYNESETKWNTISLNSGIKSWEALGHKPYIPTNMTELMDDLSNSDKLLTTSPVDTSLFDWTDIHNKPLLASNKWKGKVNSELDLPLAGSELEGQVYLLETENMLAVCVYNVTSEEYTWKKIGKLSSVDWTDITGIPNIPQMTSEFVNDTDFVVIDGDYITPLTEGGTESVVKVKEDTDIVDALDKDHVHDNKSTLDEFSTLTVEQDENKTVKRATTETFEYLSDVKRNLTEGTDYFKQTILETDWTIKTEPYRVEYILNHGLNTTNVLLYILDSNSKLTMVESVKINDANNIEFDYHDEPEELTVYILKANSLLRTRRDVNRIKGGYFTQQYTNTTMADQDDAEFIIDVYNKGYKTQILEWDDTNSVWKPLFNTNGVFDILYDKVNSKVTVKNISGEVKNIKINFMRQSI